MTIIDNTLNSLILTAKRNAYGEILCRQWNDILYAE